MSASDGGLLPRKSQFHLPEGIIYLDGNSLGPLPKTVTNHVSNMMENEWGQMLIKGWNQARWMEQPARVGNLIAKLVGAAPGSIVMGDTLSIKVYQALSAALELRPKRRVILSDSGNFPSDLYMAQGLIESLDKNYELRVVEPEAVADAIDDSVAVVMLTQVDYRSGRMHDMQLITQRAHKSDAVMIWDLAHSAGAVPVDLTQCHCEFAVGCTYKFLNGGPGAPGFIYVRPDLVSEVRPTLSGWLGHEMPFAFEPLYRAAKSIDRMRVGTPSVIQMSALEEAMKVWDGLDMHDVRKASSRLSELFIELVEKRCPQLTLASPRNANERGSQVSFAFEHGYAAMQALIARGVIGDFRAPNIMRFGIAPLYLDEQDVIAAVSVLDDVLTNRLWDKSEYKIANAVT